MANQDEEPKDPPPSQSNINNQQTSNIPAALSLSKTKLDKVGSIATSKTKIQNAGSIANITGKSATNINKSSSRVKLQKSTSAVLAHKREQASITGIRAASSRLDDDMLEPGCRKSATRSKMAIGSTISIRRTSLYGETFERGKAARYMNSYKLNSDNPFNVEKVEKILQAVMIETMEDLTYDPDRCPKQAKKASAIIRSKVKELEFDRYRLVCIVSIGEKQSQDVYVTCRFLWDTERDRYAKYVHENMHVFGIALCFGIYYE